MNCKLFASAFSSSASTTFELWSHFPDVSCSRAFSLSSTGGFAFARAHEGEVAVEVEVEGVLSASPAMIAWRSELGPPANGNDGGEYEYEDEDGDGDGDGPGS